jgi:microcystin synthetase protein McyA
VASSGTVTVTLEPEETDALLREVPAAYRTQINDVLLTALAQSLAAWTGSSCLLLDLEGHGREDLFPDLDLSRTLGWFTSLFPVRLQLPPSEDPGTQLLAVKEQLRALPHHGIGYGILRYLTPDTPLPTTPSPPLSFNYLGQFDGGEGGMLRPAGEVPGGTRSPRARRAHLLDINAMVSASQLHVAWTYSEHLHDASTIQGLADAFLTALRALITHCLDPHAGGYTPSDFPDAGLSQHELDDLLAQLEL